MMQYDKIVCEYFDDTSLTLEQIAETTGLGYKRVWNAVARNYTQEERKARKVKNYRESKLGDKNPMTGKNMEAHHNWNGGEVLDGKGYVMIRKPEWYTGRKGSKYIFKHTAVMCEALGLTELPSGWVIHHIDHNPLNNELTNLALLTNEAHLRLHQLERVTTILKGSRANARSAKQPSP